MRICLVRWRITKIVAELALRFICTLLRISVMVVCVVVLPVELSGESLATVCALPGAAYVTQVGRGLGVRGGGM